MLIAQLFPLDPCRKYYSDDDNNKFRLKGKTACCYFHSK